MLAFFSFININRRWIFFVNIWNMATMMICELTKPIREPSSFWSSSSRSTFGDSFLGWLFTRPILLLLPSPRPPYLLRFFLFFLSSYFLVPSDFLGRLLFQIVVLIGVVEPGYHHHIELDRDFPRLGIQDLFLCSGFTWCYLCETKIRLSPPTTPSNSLLFIHFWIGHVTSLNQSDCCIYALIW